MIRAQPKNIKHIFRSYYVDQLCFDIHKCPRSLLISYMLLIVQFFLEVLVQLTQPTLDTFMSNRQFSLSSLPNMKSEIEVHLSTLDIVTLSINSVILVLLVVNILTYQLFSKPISRFQIALSALVQVYNYILFIPMLAISSPVANHRNSSLLSFVNCAYTLLISGAIRIHNQDFRFESRDSLAKQTQISVQLLQLFFEAIPPLTFRLDFSPSVSSCICFCVGILGCCEAVSTQSYLNKRIQFLSFSLRVYTTSFAGMLLILAEKTRGSSSIKLIDQIALNFIPILLILIPLSIKIASAILQRSNDIIDSKQTWNSINFSRGYNGSSCSNSNSGTTHDSENQMKKLTPDSIDRIEFFLRKLHTAMRAGTYEKYKENEHSILFEEIFVAHQLSCEESSSCTFCSESMRYSEEFKIKFLGGIDRISFLHQFIQDTFRITIKRCINTSQRNATGFCFTYFSFLLHVKQQKMLCYMEIIRLKKFLRLSLREQALLSELLSQFTQEETQEPTSYESDSQITSSSSLAIKPHMIAIHFDENLNRMEAEYFETLQSKMKVLHSIGRDHIDLNTVLLEATTLIRSIRKIEAEIKLLSSINFFNTKVQFYIEAYIQNLSFGHNKRDLFRKPNKQNQYTFIQRDSKNELNQAEEQKNENRLGDPRISNHVFASDQCAVFISLSDRKLGEIERLSNNFTRFFGFTRSKSLNRSINMIIPCFIAKDHNRSIARFIADQIGVRKPIQSTRKIPQTNDNSYGNIHAETSNEEQSPSQKGIFERVMNRNHYFRLLIAKDSNGWAVPISMEVKIECDGIKHCGLAARMTRLPYLDHGCVMMNAKDFQIQIVSKRFYELFLSPAGIPKEDIPNIFMSKMIPLLHQFERNMRGSQRNSTIFESKEIIKTIAFLPKGKPSNQQVQQTLRNTQKGSTCHNIQPVKEQAKSSPFFLCQKSNLNNLKACLESLDSNSVEVFFVKFKRNSFEPAEEARNDQGYSSPPSFHILEILKMKRIVDRNEIENSLLFFKSQLRTAFNINYNEKSFFASSEIIQIDTWPNEQFTQQENEGYYNENKSELLPPDTDRIELLTKTDPFMLLSPQSSRQQQSSRTPLVVVSSATTRNSNLKGHSEASGGKNILNLQHQLSSSQQQQQQQQYSESFYQVKQKEQHQQSAATNRTITTEVLLPYSQVTANAVTLLKLPQQIHESSQVNSDQDVPQQSDIRITSIQDLLYSQLKEQYVPQSPKFNDSIGFLDPNNPAKDEHQKNENPSQLFSNFSSEFETEGGRKTKSKTVQSQNGEYDNDIVDSRIDHHESHRKNANKLPESSIRSGVSSTSVVRRQIHSLFYQKQHDVSFIILKSFGFLAIHLIVCITLFNFNAISNSLQSAREDISLIPWANNMRASFASTLNYYRLSEILYFNGFRRTVTDAAKIDSIRAQSYDQVEILQENLLVLSQISELSRREYFLYANTNQMDFLINIDDALLTSNATEKYTFRTANKTKVRMSTQYLLMNIVQSMSEYVKETTLTSHIVYYEKQYNDNFPMISLNLTRIQNLTIEQSIQLLEESADRSEQLMQIVCTVGFLLIACVTPLYAFIQYKNQSVLKLFATVPPDNLEVMVQTVGAAIQIEFESNQQSKYSGVANAQMLTSKKKREAATATVEQLKNFDRRGKNQNNAIFISTNGQTTNKRKTISTTSSLPKLNIKLGIICMVAYALCIIHPIVNYVLVNQFNQEVKENISLLGSLASMRAQISSNLSIVYTYLKNQLITEVIAYNIPYYISRLKPLSITNRSLYTDMIANVDSSTGVPKRQQGVYDNFFFKLMHSNICEAVAAYPEYVTTERNRIDQEFCVKTNNGILEEGFQVAIKSFFEVLSEVYEMSQIVDVTTRYQAIIKWEKTTRNIMDYYELNEALSKVSSIIKDFFLIVMDSDLSSILDISRFLVGYQLVLLLFVFATSWYTFLLFIQRQIMEIRSTLQVLSIEAVFENPYIMSYLRK